MSLEEQVEAEREKLSHFFSRKELRSKLVKNPVTLASLISRYHTLHFRERYLEVPPNLITPKQIVGIIKSK